MDSSTNPERCKIHQTVDSDGEKPIPKHPGPGWTRFVLISDTHTRTHYAVPEGDVLIHAGDLSSWGRVEQLEPTAVWLRSLPHPKKIVIAGNHDFCLDPDCLYENYQNDTQGHEDHKKARSLFLDSGAKEAGIEYLENEVLRLEVNQGKVWKIYGSPVSALEYHTSSQRTKVALSQRPFLELEPSSTGKAPLRKRDGNQFLWTQRY